VGVEDNTGCGRRLREICSSSHEQHSPSSSLPSATPLSSVQVMDTTDVAPSLPSSREIELETALRQRDAQVLSLSVSRKHATNTLKYRPTYTYTTHSTSPRCFSKPAEGHPSPLSFLLSTNSQESIADDCQRSSFVVCYGAFSLESTRHRMKSHVYATTSQNSLHLRQQRPCLYPPRLSPCSYPISTLPTGMTSVQAVAMEVAVPQIPSLLR
jgi:hypothetical protein